MIHKKAKLSLSTVISYAKLDLIRVFVQFDYGLSGGNELVTHDGQLRCAPMICIEIISLIRRERWKQELIGPHVCDCITSQ